MLSCSIVTSVSRKGSEPCCVGSTVNWMLGSWLLMCLRGSWLCSAQLMTKVSSTNLSHREGVWGGAKGFHFRLFHEDVGYEGADGGSHSCNLDLFIILTLDEEIGVGETELHQGSDLWDGHVGSLWESSVLLESLFNYLYGWLHRNRGKQNLYIKGGDDLPWFQLSALELLYEMLCIFKVVRGLMYQGFDDVC